MRAPVLPNQTQSLVRQPAVVPSKHTDGEKSVSFEKNAPETRRDRDGWCSSIMMGRTFLKIKWLGFGVAARKRTEAGNSIHTLVKFNVHTIKMHLDGVHLSDCMFARKQLSGRPCVRSHTCTCKHVASSYNCLLCI